MTQDREKQTLIGEGPVLLRFHDGVAELTLNRPKAANGMSVELLKHFHEAIMICHGHPGLRVLVLRGAGDNFCGGGDVRDFASRGDALPDYLRAATAYLQVVACLLYTSPSPRDRSLSRMPSSA